jgi:hypothetical protein
VVVEVEEEEEVGEEEVGEEVDKQTEAQRLEK